MPSKYLYQRFGAVTPNAASVARSFQSVPGAFKDVTAGIQDLLDTQEEKAKMNNTANMAEYLKTKMQREGLAGDGTVDEAAATKHFGGRVDIAALKASALDTRAGMEKEAYNAASLAGATSFEESNDPIMARKAVEKSLRDSGAQGRFLATSLNAWNTNNELKIKDAESLKLRDEATRNEGLIQHMSVGGNRKLGIENAIKGMNKFEQAAERRRMNTWADNFEKLTDAEKLEIKYNTDLEANEGLQENTQAASKLAQAITAQEKIAERGLQERSYSLSDKYSQNIGGSVVNTIRQMIEDPAEIWGTDTDAIAAKRTELLKTYNEKDVNAAIAQGFQNNFSGDPEDWFNDLSASELEGVLSDAERYLENISEQEAYDSIVTAARNNVSDTEARTARRAIDFNKSLTDAAVKDKYAKPGQGTNLEDREGMFKSRLEASADRGVAGGISGNFGRDGATTPARNEFTGPTDTAEALAAAGGGGATTTGGKALEAGRARIGAAGAQPEVAADAPVAPEVNTTADVDARRAARDEFKIITAQKDDGTKPKYDEMKNEYDKLVADGNMSESELAHLLPMIHATKPDLGPNASLADLSRATGGGTTTGINNRVDYHLNKVRKATKGMSADQINTYVNDYYDTELDSKKDTQYEGIREKFLEEIDRRVKNPSEARQGRIASAKDRALLPKNDPAKPVSLSFKNRNPGNIRFNDDVQSAAEELGISIPTDSGGFAKFASVDDGMKVMRRLLFEWKGYRNLNLIEAITKYAPPTENDTAAYVADVKRVLGKRYQDTPMNELNKQQQDAIMKAMINHEGYHQGKG